MVTLVRQVDSASIDFDIDYSYQDRRTKQESKFRSKSGRLYRYLFSEYEALKIKAIYVDSASMNFINNAWSNNQSLNFIDASSNVTEGLQIVNRRQPINKFKKPYATLMEGVIELEGEGAA